MAITMTTMTPSPQIPKMIWYACVSSYEIQPGSIVPPINHTTNINIARYTSIRGQVTTPEGNGRRIMMKDGTGAGITGCLEGFNSSILSPVDV